MKCLRFLLLVLLAASAARMPLQAQTVYRCGSSYSHTPCPGSTPLDVSDERSKAQKAQTDAAIQRDRHTAQAMEKERLRQEAIQARATAVSSGSQGSSKAATTHGQQAVTKQKPHADRKGRQPEYFTASATGEKSKKKSPNAPATAP